MLKKQLDMQAAQIQVKNAVDQMPEHQVFPAR
jgi:hypothetical protein